LYKKSELHQIYNRKSQERERERREKQKGNVIKRGIKEVASKKEES